MLDRTHDRTESDESLLARFVSGDDAAMGALAARYEAALIGVARGFLHDEPSARDAVQDTWVRVIRSAAGFDGRASVKTWLYTILLNRCRDIRRSELSRRRRERTVRPTRGSGDSVGVERRVHDAVEQLGEPGRETLVLCFHRGLTHAEAAAVLGVPIGTVKSRLHKAMSRLRAALGVAECETEAPA